MGRTIDDLHPIAQPIAEKLARYVNIKTVLSAGVLALDTLSDADKHKFYSQVSFGKNAKTKLRAARKLIQSVSLQILTPDEIAELKKLRDLLSDDSIAAIDDENAAAIEAKAARNKDKGPQKGTGS